MIQKIKTIVCGSTFGQYYIDALKKYSEFFEVTGLLARGSRRSLTLAEKNGIPLFTDINKIPEDIVLACVVIRSEGVGGEGCEVAQRLMERGIHIIQEQPIYPKNLMECYRTAKKYEVIYSIGNLYMKLPEVQRFIKVSRKLGDLNALRYMSLYFCTQVAYPALSILIEAISGFREWKNLSVIKGNGPFDIITGQAGAIPITIEFNNKINPQVPDDFMYILHKFLLFFESGTLSLEDTFGPVTWRPRIYVEKYGEEGSGDDRLKEVSFALLKKYEEKKIGKIFQDEWSDAIGLEMLEMKEQIKNKRINSEKMQKDYLAAKLWEELYHVVGYANLTDERDYQYVSVNSIRES